MIMEVRQAAGREKREEVCVFVRRRDAAGEIALQIPEAKHKNSKCGGGGGGTAGKEKFFSDFLECRSRFCPSWFFHNVAPSPLLFLTASADLARRDFMPV